jgi:hypothetical protein
MSSEQSGLAGTEIRILPRGYVDTEIPCAWNRLRSVSGGSARCCVIRVRSIMIRLETSGPAESRLQNFAAFSDRLDDADVVVRWRQKKNLPHFWWSRFWHRQPKPNPAIELRIESICNHPLATIETELMDAKVLGEIAATKSAEDPFSSAK